MEPVADLLLSPSAFVEGTRIVTTWTHPRRIAYILPEDRQDLLIEAVAECCLTWGGMDSLLVPCKDQISVTWRKVLQAYGPDLIVAFSEVSDVDRAWFAERRLTVVSRPLTENSLSHTPGVSLYSALRAFGTKPSETELATLAVSPDHPYRLPLVARYGVLDEKQAQPYLRSWIGDLPELSSYVRVSELNPDLPLELLLFDAQITANYAANGRIIKRTLPYLTVKDVPRSQGPATVYLEDPVRTARLWLRTADYILVTGDATSVADFCLFWDLRGNRSSSDFFPLWIPLEFLQTEAGSRQLASTLVWSGAHERSLRGEPRLDVVSASRDLEEVTFSSPIAVRKTAFGDAPSLFNPSFERGLREEHEVTFRRGRGNIPRPRTREIYLFGPHDMVGFEATVEGVMLPPIHEWLPVGWDVTYSGFERPAYPRSFPSFEALHLPSGWDTLRLAFAAAGYTVRPSPAGVLATGVLALFGSLEAIAILRSKPAFGLLAELSKTTGRQWLKGLIKQAGKSDEDLEAMVRDTVQPQTRPDQARVTLGWSQAVQALGKEAAGPVLEWLLRKRVVFRGSTLRCPICRMSRWYVLDLIGSELRCEGCQEMITAPLRLDRTEWEYRVNELYAFAFDQGVLPHLLLAHERYVDKTREESLFGFYPGVLITRQDGTEEHEIDYVEIRDGRVVMAECKVDPRSFNAEAARALGLLANVVGEGDVIVAAVAAEFGEDVLGELTDTARGEVIALGPNEFFDRLPRRNYSDPVEYLDAVLRQLATLA